MESRVCPLRTGQSSCFTSDLLELREVSFDCWVYLSLKLFTLTREQWSLVSSFLISMCNNYNCGKLYVTTGGDTKTRTRGPLSFPVPHDCPDQWNASILDRFSIPENFYLVIISVFLKEKPLVVMGCLEHSFSLLMYHSKRGIFPPPKALRLISSRS